MSRKQIRTASSPTVATEPSKTREVDKLIQKGRLKDAVKAAKLCFKEDGTPENHQLLERAYFLRARQLLQLGMADSAREVAGHLLEFGLTTNEWTAELLRLLVSLGLSDHASRIQAQSDWPELTDELLALAADMAVIHPERAQNTPPEIAREAKLIRESLEKICSGDDEGGLTPLRDLPRSSLLSEWKFFARGLVAHYRGEPEESHANWDRLDPKRQARRIADRLRQMAGSEGAIAAGPNLAALEKQAFGEPVIARLGELRGAVGEQDWDKATRLLAGLRPSLHRIEERLAERLTRILMAPYIHGASELNPLGAQQLLDRFTACAQPLAIDPSWNRFHAIAANQTAQDTETARDRWAAFIAELDTIPAFSPADRPLLKAMVWNAVSMLYCLELQDFESEPSLMAMFSPYYLVPDEKAEAVRLKKQSIDSLEKSLALAPDHLPTYRLLFETHERFGNEAASEAAARRLLERFPDDFETLELLANRCQAKDELDLALSYLQKARVQKPLDHSLRERESTIRIGLARCRALEKRWEDGRSQFLAAEELAPDLRKEYYCLARKVLFEAKAGQRDASDQFQKEAMASLEDPTPLWLVLTIESIRYRFSATMTTGYAELWTAGLKKKCQSRTAGEMAKTLDAYLKSEVEYPGRQGHVEKLVGYLKRTTRLKFRQIDIERVCEFLMPLPNQKELLEKLLRLGLKQHPESVLLNFQSGMLAVACSRPPFIPRVAKNHLEKALKHAEASSVARETALVPDIKAALTMINETQSLGGRSPFRDGPFSFPGEEFDSQEFFPAPDFDFGFSGFFDPEPRPAPRAKKGARKNQTQR